MIIRDSPSTDVLRAHHAREPSMNNAQVIAAPQLDAATQPSPVEQVPKLLTA